MPSVSVAGVASRVVAKVSSLDSKLACLQDQCVNNYIATKSRNLPPSDGLQPNIVMASTLLAMASNLLEDILPAHLKKGVFAQTCGILITVLHEFSPYSPRVSQSMELYFFYRRSEVVISQIVFQDFSKPREWALIPASDVIPAFDSKHCLSFESHL